MTAGDGGWWAAPIELAPGTDYAFAIDGGEPLPDPRSPWQPGGIHGPSRTVDHGAFAWTDAGWRAPPLASGAIYELHVGTFTPAGTFDSAIERLPELVELGATHVELMPVAEFSGERGWGYDGVDLYAPHHAYGGPDGLKRLIDAAHGIGLAVILDVVYNHLGPAGNYLDRFAPYFTDRYTTPWGRAVNYDGPGSREVRRFVVDNALTWLRDYHVDGLRLDAIHSIFDGSERHILRQLRDEVRSLEAEVGRPLLVTVETDRVDPRLVRATDAGGHGLDAAWNDDFHHALHSLLTGERMGYYADFGEMAQLADALERGSVRRSNAGDADPGLRGDRLIGFAQNHDQIGNRARGERLVHLVGRGRAKIAAAVLLTAPFVPLIFQGEEWAASTPFLYFSDHRDPGLAEAVRAGRRSEFAAFGWHPDEIPDPQDAATFRASVLRRDERAEPERADMLAWYRALLALRRSRPALADPRLSEVGCRHDAAAGWFVMERGDTAVALNLGPEAACLDLAGELLLASEPAVAREGGCLRLPPDTVAILAA
ncbi:MAG: malto-oligosyltrehalose trehalohydrolase [Chloroflexota bacterium]|nr:malto-oligosyltrehalose trehalohydrolase [Chloroflexota bacterium]